MWFLLATIKIKDRKRGNIFLHFGVIEVLDSPNIFHGDLFIRDFSNLLDLSRLHQVMEDERGLDDDVQTEEESCTMLENIV